MASFTLVGHPQSTGGRFSPLVVANREVLVPQLRRAEGEAVWRRLRRTLTVEMLVMGLGVLLATALMTSGGL